MTPTRWQGQRMISEPSKLSPVDDPVTLEEQLVAYLDGELEDEEVRRVEALVTADPKARELLAGLERTWAVLDRLDRTPLDEVFTRTTMEMVAVAAEGDLGRQRAEAPRRRHRRRWIGAGALLATALAGFLVAARFWPDPNRRLLEDLPLLEDFDEYRQIDDVGFLRMLHEQGLFAKDAGDGT